MERGGVKGLDILEKALLDKKGVILIGGHFSGDRVGKFFLREMGFPIMNVRTKSPRSFLMSSVEKKYFVPLETDILNSILKDYVFIEDKGFAIEVLKRLRENGLVSILVDARATTQGIHCPFLGGRRFFPTNFLEIARLTGAAVVPMVCIGNSLSFAITFEERLQIREAATKNEFVSVNLLTAVKVLEAQIMNYPGHWLIMGN